MDRLLKNYSNREISFRYDGKEVSFFLSQALFSSFEVDRGSRLLLETLAETAGFDKIKSVLDIGCGVGILGVTLKKRYPHLQLTFQDRDALATAFTGLNCRRNGIDQAEILGGLALSGLEERFFDLIISNIPAKAGAPVLADLYRSMLRRLAQGGRAAIVVVEAIRDFTLETLVRAGAELTTIKPSKGHTVICFSPGEETDPSKRETHSDSQGQFVPRVYFRDHIHCEVNENRYELDTVWGSAGFDTPPYTAHLAARVRDWVKSFHKGLIWNPGQGHTASVLLCDETEATVALDLGGRDALELQACRHNLTLYGRPKVKTRLYHCADPEELHDLAGGEYDLFVTVLENLAGLPAPSSLLAAAERLLAREGLLVILGKSAHVHVFGNRTAGFSTVGSKKHRGYRALLLRKR